MFNVIIFVSEIQNSLAQSSFQFSINCYTVWEYVELLFDNEVIKR